MTTIKVGQSVSAKVKYDEKELWMLCTVVRCENSGSKLSYVVRDLLQDNGRQWTVPECHIIQFPQLDFRP